MLSYWEKQSFLSHDFIIVGSGIVGMSTAVELKEQFPKSKILILERSVFPYGASSRNAGFACVGSVSEYLDDQKSSGEESIQNIFEKRYLGLNILRNRLGDGNICYRERGSYDLLEKREKDTLDHINYFNKLFRPILSKDAFSVNTSYLHESGMNTKHFSHCIECHADGEIHTGKMLTALHQLCIEKGIIIKTGVIVDTYDYTESQAQVVIKDAVRNEDIFLNTEKLIFCTNAFTKTFFPAEDIEPGRGQVLVTQPIQNLSIQGIHHFHRGYYYFREIDGRILFGGGRHLDFNHERTVDMEFNQNIIDNLIFHLRENILPKHKNIDIDMNWAGIMAFGNNKEPLLFNIGSSIWCAARLGGMGVAIGSLLARELVRKISEHE